MLCVPHRQSYITQTSEVLITTYSSLPESLAACFVYHTATSINTDTSSNTESASHLQINDHLLATVVLTDHFVSWTEDQQQKTSNYSISFISANSD